MTKVYVLMCFVLPLMLNYAIVLMGAFTHWDFTADYFNMALWDVFSRGLFISSYGLMVVTLLGHLAMWCDMRNNPKLYKENK